MISMQAILKQIEFLPVFNQTAQKALKLLLQYDTNNKDIAEVIKYDPGLTANVLKLANSAYFAHSKEINDLLGAVNYLGRDKMFTILTVSTAAKYFSKKLPGYEMFQGELWQHSISTGVIAEHLSYLEPEINKSSLFTAGILHDIGKIVLSTWVSDLWNDIVYMVKNNKTDFVEAENKILGYSHALVGGAILQRWGFPDVIVQAAKKHHEIKINTNPVVRIVRLADYMSILIGFTTSEDNLAYKGYDDLLGYYQVKTKDLEKILNDCFEIIKSVMDDFKKIE
ncbi:MAG: HDOD domain-containing protein [Candidatus Cloacimonetes bacterium]|nr:HDOD domain-containing protein [Candidatus Cloacimonadota bacterium]